MSNFEIPDCPGAYGGPSCDGICGQARNVINQRDYGFNNPDGSVVWPKPNWEEFIKNTLIVAQVEGCIRLAELRQTIGQSTQILENEGRLV